MRCRKARSLCRPKVAGAPGRVKDSGSSRVINRVEEPEDERTDRAPGNAWEALFGNGFESRWNGPANAFHVDPGTQRYVTPLVCVVAFRKPPMAHNTG